MKETNPIHLKIRFVSCLHKLNSHDKVNIKITRQSEFICFTSSNLNFFFPHEKILSGKVGAVMTSKDTSLPLLVHVRSCSGEGP